MSDLLGQTHAEIEVDLNLAPSCQLLLSSWQNILLVLVVMKEHDEGSWTRLLSSGVVLSPKPVSSAQKISLKSSVINLTGLEPSVFSSMPVTLKTILLIVQFNP